MAYSLIAPRLPSSETGPRQARGGAGYIKLLAKKLIDGHHRINLLTLLILWY
ncbi:MAG: hypothetical protein ACPL5I_02670 [Thermodesulfobacteriota bacterium]